MSNSTLTQIIEKVQTGEVSTYDVVYSFGSPNFLNRKEKRLRANQMLSKIENWWTSSCSSFSFLVLKIRRATKNQKVSNRIRVECNLNISPQLQWKYVGMRWSEVLWGVDNRLYWDPGWEYCNLWSRLVKNMTRCRRDVGAICQQNSDSKQNIATYCNFWQGAICEALFQTVRGKTSCFRTLQLAWRSTSASLFWFDL